MSSDEVRIPIGSYPSQNQYSFCFSEILPESMWEIAALSFKGKLICLLQN